MKSSSLILLMIVLLSSWTICCAEVGIRTEVYEGVIPENQLLSEMRQIRPSDMFIRDACSVGERTYILSTPYEALSETGPYSLYRIRNGVVEECGFTDRVSCFTTGENGKLYFVEAPSTVWQIDELGIAEKYCADVPRRILSLVEKNGMLFAATEQELWAVSQGSWRKMPSLNGMIISDMWAMEDAIVCELTDGSYRRMILEPDREEPFYVCVPDQWQDARYEVTVNAFSEMFPEYEVVLTESVELADVAIVDAADFNSATTSSLHGAVNLYFKEETGTALLFDHLLPMRSMGDIYGGWDEEGGESEGVQEEYDILPVDCSIWMLAENMKLPDDCPRLKENCTFEELYAWAAEIKDKTGIAGFADDTAFPIAIRAYIASFRVNEWDFEAIFQSEEMLELLRLSKEGIKSGSVVSLGAEAFFTMKLVEGYMDMENVHPIPKIRSGRVYPAECSVIGDSGATEDILRNDAKRQFLYIYLAKQDQIDFNAPGADLLADITAYANGGRAEIHEEQKELWQSAFSDARLPNWRRYPSEKIPFEKFMLDCLNDYFTSEMDAPTAGRFLSSYIDLMSNTRVSVR